MATTALHARLLPVILVLITSLVSLAIFSLRDYRNTGKFMKAVIADRATISSIVQVLSSVLGMMQVYIATTLFNFATRIWLLEKGNSITLGSLSLFTALSVPRADLTLPIGKIAIVVVALAATQLPGALWAGSITPIIMSVSQEGFIQIPTFTAETRNIWDSEFHIRGVKVWNILDNCTSSDMATRVTSCPIPHLHGSILNSAGLATTISGAPRNHSKIDSPSWYYRGRSYGVGSSQGLVSPSGVFANARLSAYNYTEVGYTGSVQCIKNSSSQYGFVMVPEHHEPKTLTVWEVQGYLPNSEPDNPEVYPSITWSSQTSKPYVLVWSAVVNNQSVNRNMIAIAAGEPYALFNQTQCTVTFLPTAFSISVNTSEQSISVTPLPNTPRTKTPDIEPTTRLTSNVIWSLNLLSRMTPSLYESTLANTLKQNAATMHARHNSSSSSPPISDDADLTLRAIEDSFAAMIDDILVAFGAAQLVLSNSSTPVTVTAQLPALQIGKMKYVVWTLALNMVLLFCVVVQAVRTRLWHDLPLFNYLDVKSVIVAASAEGCGSVAEKVDLYRKEDGLKDGVGMGEVEICLEPRGAGVGSAAVAIKLAEKYSDGEETELGQSIPMLPKDRRDS